MCRPCTNGKQREFRSRNPEDTALKSREYRSKNIEKARAYSKKWGENNKESRRGTLVRRRAADPKGEWSKTTLANCKARALKAKIPFSITSADILPLCVDFCPALGFKLNYPVECISGAGPMADSPSLDRIIPSLGYTVGNIVVISKMANCIKQDANAYQIAAVAKWLEGLE